METWPRSDGPRLKIIKLRVTAEEKRHVKDVAAQLEIPVSTYLRRMLFGNERGIVAGKDHVMAQNHVIRERRRQNEQSD